MERFHGLTRCLPLIAALVATSASSRAQCPEWSALGNGLSGGVHALKEFDDGTGPALFAAGSFPGVGGASANRVAKWDGMNWSALDSGLYGGMNALEVFDDGTGPALFAGGGPSSINGGIAKWNGTNGRGLAAV